MDKSFVLRNKKQVADKEKVDIEIMLLELKSNGNGYLDLSDLFEKFMDFARMSKIVPIEDLPYLLSEFGEYIIAQNRISTDFFTKTGDEFFIVCSGYNVRVIRKGVLDNFLFCSIADGVEPTYIKIDVDKVDRNFMYSYCMNDGVSILKLMK